MSPGVSRVGEVNAVTITRDMFRVYGEHVAVVVSTSAIIQFVALATTLLSFSAFGIAGFAVWLLVSGIAYQLSIGVYTLLLLHLRHGHEVSSPSYLIRESSKHLGRLLWLATITGFGIFFGYLLLVIPGIYLTLRWAVAAPALVAQRTSAVEAMRVSAERTQGVKGTVWALSVIAAFFTNGIPQIVANGNPTMATENVIIVGAVIATFATPIVALATAELFLRLSRVPDRIQPGDPFGGPAPAPPGVFVPTSAVPVQPAPGPFVPTPQPIAQHAYAPPAPGPTPQHAYAPPAPQPQHAYAPPAPQPQHAYAPPAPQPHHAYAPPAPQPQHAYVPPLPPHAQAAPPGPAPAPRQRQGPSVGPPGFA